jgi:hypothetical protein
MTTRSRYTAAITDKPWWLAGGIPRSACIAAYQARGASSLAASYTNLASPGRYTLAEVATPTWDTIDGWVGDNSDNQLNTGIIQNISATMIVKFSGHARGTRNDMAGVLTYESGDKYYIIGNWSNGFRFYKGGGNYYLGAGIAAGVACISGYRCFMNGVYLGSIAAGGALSTSATMRLLHSSADPFSGKMQAASFYYDEFSDYQIATLTNAMNAL